MTRNLITVTVRRDDVRDADGQEIPLQKRNTASYTERSIHGSSSMYFSCPQERESITLQSLFV